MSSASKPIASVPDNGGASRFDRHPDTADHPRLVLPAQPGVREPPHSTSPRKTRRRLAGLRLSLLFALASLLAASAGCACADAPLRQARSGSSAEQAISVHASTALVPLIVPTALAVPRGTQQPGNATDARRARFATTPTTLPASGGSLRLVAVVQGTRTCRFSSSGALKGLPASADCVLGGGAAFAASSPLNPLRNMPLPANYFSDACAQAPLSAVCERGIVKDLNAARKKMGFGSYRLPADFIHLPGAQQILVLTNLDRAAYGEAPLVGSVLSLSRLAAAGVIRDSDPTLPSVVDGQRVLRSGGIEAGNFLNAPAAYYEWMYDDGWDGNGSNNVFCWGPHAPGCWGHRDVLLAPFSPGTTGSIGVSVRRDRSGHIGYAAVIVVTAAPLTR